MIDNAKNSNTSDTISSSNIVQNLNLAIEKDARVSVAIKNANGQNVSVQEAKAWDLVVLTVLLRHTISMRQTEL